MPIGTSRNLLLVATLATVLCGCAGPQVRQDRNRLRKLRDLAERAQSHENDPEVVLDYSVAVRNTWEAGTFRRCPPAEGDQTDAPCHARAERHVERAARLLETVAGERKRVAPKLLAEKGVLLLIAGRTDAGLEQLRRSLEIRPTYDAAVALVVWHGRREERDRVDRACRRTYPRLEKTQKRYKLLELCVKFSGASSVDAALDWASSETRAFYRKQRRKRRRRRIRRRRSTRRRARRCVADCRRRLRGCRRGCRNESCRSSCASNYQSCIDRCRARFDR